MNRVGLINYGGGNVSSVANALRYLHVDFEEVTQPDALGSYSRLILPGVGAFDAAMARLSAAGWPDAIRAHTLQAGRPFLGICLGMQLLAGEGTEFTPTPGLALIEGRVVRMELASLGLTIPHMGWNEVRWERPHPLLMGLGSSAHYYFVHSYHFEVINPAACLGRSTYGIPFTAMVQEGPVVGAQFHPEKSQREGLLLLKNFCSWNP